MVEKPGGQISQIVLVLDILRGQSVFEFVLVNIADTLNIVDDASYL